MFSASDPWYIAALSAFAIDGLITYSMYSIGTWVGDQRKAGFVGVGLFAFISGTAQIISRFRGLGLELPEVLYYISLGLVPLSTTGAVVVLGFVHYFDAKKGDRKPSQYNPGRAVTTPQRPIIRDDDEDLAQFSLPPYDKSMSFADSQTDSFPMKPK